MPCCTHEHVCLWWKCLCWSYVCLRFLHGIYNFVFFYRFFPMSCFNCKKCSSWSWLCLWFLNRTCHMPFFHIQFVCLFSPWFWNVYVSVFFMECLRCKLLYWWRNTLHLAMLVFDVYVLWLLYVIYMFVVSTWNSVVCHVLHVDIVVLELYMFVVSL